MAANTFTASTAAQLNEFYAAPSQPVVGKAIPWTQAMGWEGALDKDGFVKGTTKEEKEEIRAMIAKGMACLEKQKKEGRVFDKPAKAEKTAEQPKAEKKPAAKVAKPAAKKAGKVSKYGLHDDGTVQYVPARKIYHGWFEGKIAVVSSKADVVKAKLLEMGVEATIDVVFGE